MYIQCVEMYCYHKCQGRCPIYVSRDLIFSHWCFKIEWDVSEQNIPGMQISVAFIRYVWNWLESDPIYGIKVLHLEWNKHNFSRNRMKKTKFFKHWGHFVQKTKGHVTKWIVATKVSKCKKYHHWQKKLGSSKDQSHLKLLILIFFSFNTTFRI